MRAFLAATPLLVLLALAPPRAAAQEYATACSATYDACVDYPARVFVPDPRQSDDTWRGFVVPSDPRNPNLRMDFLGRVYDGPYGADSFEELLHQEAAELATYAEVTYRHLDRRRRFFVLSGVERVRGYGEVVFYSRYMRMPDGFVVVDLRYPRAAKPTMDRHVVRISHSLRPRS